MFNKISIINKLIVNPKITIRSSSNFHQIGDLSNQENSAGRPCSQSQLPQFESFRHIAPNVFVDDDMLITNETDNGVLPVNFESFNREEVEQEKKKTQKKRMFNVKNNRQINNLRQKVIERNFRGGFNTDSFQDFANYSDFDSDKYSEKIYKQKRNYTDNHESIDGKIKEQYAKNIQQSLEDIEKGIGEVVKKISCLLYTSPSPRD